MKKKIIISILIFTVAVGGYFYFRNGKPKIEYTTSEAAKGKLSQTVSVTGEVTPIEKSNLAFKLGGRLVGINVGVGDRVEEKQKLAEIEKGTLEESLKQAELDVEYQKKTYVAMRRKKDTYNGAQREAQRALIKKSEEALKAINEQIDETFLYAPFSGIIIKKNLNLGEVAVANSAVLTLAREGDLIIEADVPESDIVKIAIGQKADVTFDSLSSEEIAEAEVYEIDPASTVIQDVVYYKIKLKLSKKDDRLKSGMSSDVEIRTAEKDNVVMVPIRAVISENNRNYVNILKDRENNITEKVEVKTGLEGNEGMVEIISGIKPGDEVITFTKENK